MASSWVQGDDLPNGKYNSGGFGTQTAAINSGGYDSSEQSTVEEYDGTAWASATSLPGPRQTHDSVGSVSAGFIAGGYYIDASPKALDSCYDYDGSAWSVGGSLILEANEISIFGSPVATVKAGGRTATGWEQDEVEEYDGTAWSSATAITYARTAASCAGELSAGFVAGGWELGGATVYAIIEEYDGTSWAFGDALTTPTLNAGCFGSLADGMYVGGQDKNDSYDASTTCEYYDGTSFSQGPLLWRATSHYGIANNGLKITAMLIGGNTTQTAVVTTTYFSYEPGIGDPCYIYKADSISIVDLSEIKDLPLIGTVVYGQADSYDEDNGVTFANRWIGGTPDGIGNAEVLLIDSGEDSISGVINIGTGTVTIEQNKYGSGNTLTVYYKTGTTEEACEAASWIEYTEPFISSGFVQCKVEGP